MIDYVIIRPPQPEPDQTREQYGLCVLAYVVAERSTWQLTSDQINLALHVAPIASAVHVTIDPDCRRQVDYRTAAADAVADAKRALLGELRRRAEAIAELARQADQSAVPTGTVPTSTTGTVPTSTVPPSDDRPDGGSKVPRRPIVPSRPPAGQYADDPRQPIF